MDESKAKKTPPLKLKAILLSNDGGRTFICVRQYYACWQPEGQYSGLFFQGKRLRVVPDEEGGDQCQK